MTHFESLEAKINSSGGNPALMLRQEPAGPYVFPMPAEYSNWRDEQEAWTKTAILFDQSFHMFDIYFKGPDVKRLFSDFGVNNFSKFGRNKAKQFVAVNHEGMFIGDAILFGIEEDEYSLVGTPIAGNYMQYRAETGDYHVTVVRDNATPFNPNPRLLFRYQIQGPNALKVVEKAAGGPIDRIKFFNIGEIVIAGTKVRALNHTMSGVPGREMTGLEMTGPADEGPKVLAALQAAGEDFGLRMGGRLSYPTTAVESGWLALPIPAIYTGEELKNYREWLPAAGLEAHYSLGGSLHSNNIEDYYVTPYDIGYGRLIDFNHDFHGKDALLRIADGKHKKKVWLVWNEDDLVNIVRSSLWGGADRAKFVDMPSAIYSVSTYDRILKNNRTVGFSAWNAYTVGHGAWASIGVIDDDDAIDGDEVTIIWGDQESIGHKLLVEAHKETSIRATIKVNPLV
ncbi:aminomethyltransferase family protein [Mycolicibacterium chlorophenolicum]|uniref:Aminomethyltransferase n=1 Tax=Mycolicibacterium chlorophenolicum TaxID=37916 RepID=A0A0J6WK85_9MYCO|nr:aminomethyltransferase family protein [Mycolicibacterium chlorophenolicum]KMO83745.1 Aminomethyltransferase [Mycolicibacterium chlorophenolicum]